VISSLPDDVGESRIQLGRAYRRVGHAVAGIDYSMEQARFEYRVCLMQQCPAQVITSDPQGGNDRGADLLAQLHLRPLHAAADNDALALLDEF
jgi:hypothetical protein